MGCTLNKRIRKGIKKGKVEVTASDKGLGNSQEVNRVLKLEGKQQAGENEVTLTFHSDRTNTSITPDIICGFALIFPNVGSVDIQDVNTRKEVLRHDLVLLATPKFSLVFMPRNLKWGSTLQLTFKMNVSSFQCLNGLRLFAEDGWF